MMLRKIRSLVVRWVVGLTVLSGFPSIALSHDNNGHPCPPNDEIDILAEFRETVGLPIFHNDQIDGSELTLVCKDRFCAMHNSATKTPLWVMEKMSHAISCGSNKRPSGWRAENVGGKPRATNGDYTHSGWARGHNAASDDFKSRRDWMKQTFTFANSVPQIQDGFNGTYWRYLEEHIQHLARSGHDIFVVTGPIAPATNGMRQVIPASGGACNDEIEIAGESELGQTSICGGSAAGGPTRDCSSGVGVPAGLFKVVYLARYDRAFAYIASNTDHRPKAREYDHYSDYIETWRVSLRTVEEFTDIEFFPKLDARRSRVNKSFCIATPKH